MNIFDFVLSGGVYCEAESRAKRPVSRVRSIPVGLRRAIQAGTRSHVYREQVKIATSRRRETKNNNRKMNIFDFVLSGGVYCEAESRAKRPVSRVRSVRVGLRRAIQAGTIILFHKLFIQIRTADFSPF